MTGSESPAPDDFELATSPGETIDDASARDGGTIEYVSAVDPSTSPAKRRRLPVVPGYDVLGVLGQGGMGVVYRARQRGLDRLVALKMIVGGSHADPAQHARFLAEARAVAQLQHPNIVQVYEIGEHDGLPYFSLEFVNGGSLQQLLGRKPQSARESVQFLEVVARAIEYAHRAGIVHRDLKPANILLSVGSGQSAVGSENPTSLLPTASCPLPTVPKVADFGLAKQIDDDSSATRTGTVLGTPSYMAPEQAWGTSKDAGAIVDVYALGAILYEMLTGRPPFQGATVLETLEQVRTLEPLPPTSLLPSIPRDVETICLKCLQKDPAKRYATAGDFADDLRRWLDGKPIVARPVSKAERLVRWCRRNPWVAAFIIVLTATAVTSIVYAYTFDRERKRAEKNEERANIQADAADRERNRAEANAQVAMNQADTALDLVYNQVTYVHTKLADDADVPPKVLQDLLEDAFKGLDSVALRAEKTPLADRTRAGVFQRKGRIYFDLGKLDRAEEQLVQAQDLVDRLVSDNPNNAAAHAAQGVVMFWRGKIAERRGDTSSAEKYFKRGLEARQRRLDLQPGLPEALNQLAIGLGALGRLALNRGEPAAALGYYQQELAAREQAGLPTAEDENGSRELCGCYDQLGYANMKLRAGSASRGHFEEALRRRIVTAGRNPIARLQDDLALSQTNLGDTSLLLLKDFGSAQKHYEEAVRIREVLAKDSRKPELKARLADALYRLGSACLKRGDSSLADAHFARSLELREAPGLAAAKTDVRTRVPYMLTLASYGRHADAARIAGELSAIPTRSPTRAYYVSCGYALCLAALKHPRATPPPGADMAALTEQYTTLALKHLRQTVELGWKDALELESNPELDALRDNAEFTELVKTVQARESAKP